MSTRFTILWVMLLAFGLRLARLPFQPLWWDEGWSLYFATTDVRTMLELTAVDIHPPFYYFLLHFWTALFGPSSFSVRLLSALIGAAAVPLLYAVGRRLLGKRGGLLAASLLAVSPFHIYYSQEVRMYGLVTLLGLAAFYFALAWRLGVGGWRSGRWFLVGYVLAATAALYTQYYALFLLAALNLAALLRWRRPSTPAFFPDRGGSLLPWLGAQVAVVLLYLPWLGYAGGKLLTYVRFKVGVEQDTAQGLLAYVGRHLAAFDWGHAEGPLAEWWWVGLLPLAVLLLTLVFLPRRAPGQWAHRALVVLLLVVLGGGFVVNLILPFNPPRSERLLLLALPYYLLLAAAGLLALWRHRRSLAILPLASFVGLGLLSLAFFYTIPRYPDDDYRPLADRVRAWGLPSDAVVCVHPWQVGYFQSYLPDDETRPALMLTPREALPRERQLWADDPALLAADLEALLAEHGRLWFPDHRSMGRVLESQIEGYLVEHSYPVLSEWYGENTVLSLFARGEPTAQPVRARFGAWLTLESAALDPGPLEAGWGVIPVALGWQASEPPGESYHVGLRLVGPTGHVWAQRDAPPLGGLAEFAAFPVDEPRLDRHGLLVPAGTPPGEYVVTLRVYRAEDVAVLPVTFEGGSGGEVTLGAVRVVRPETPPPVEALGIEQPLRVDWGPLRLLGSRLGSDAPLQPGEAVAVDLFWQALTDPGEDFLPRLQLLDAEGAVLAELTEKPAAGTYPTAWWQADDLVRDPHALPIPAAVPAGRYRLALGLVRAADGAAVEFRPGRTTVDLAEIEVVGRERRYQPTTPQYPQIARFGASVELIGYDLPSPTSLTLHWRALATPDRDYYAFVHFLDAEGRIVAQDDGVPGGLPTLGWLPGEYITDPHQLSLPADLPPGVYRLAVGLYDPRTGQRPAAPVILDRGWRRENGEWRVENGEWRRENGGGRREEGGGSYDAIALDDSERP